jgi:hypothetical protein
MTEHRKLYDILLVVALILSIAAVVINVFDL